VTISFDFLWVQIFQEMNQGKYVFAQIIEFLPLRVFDRIVKKYNGNKHIRTFTCWNQMLCMVFGQLTTRDSLRDLIVALNAIVGKEHKIERTTYEILQILGISLLDKTPVKELLTNNDYKDVKELHYKQLSLSLF
jgi:Domain of unknown function (DUF4372)